MRACSVAPSITEITVTFGARISKQHVEYKEEWQAFENAVVDEINRIQTRVASY